VKYLNKSFSVYANQRTEPTCYTCGQDVKIGYRTKDGLKCKECYGETKKLHKIIQEVV